MRALPYFVGAAIIVAIGGAAAGGAIDTTPRQIHESTNLPKGSGIGFDGPQRPRAPANHYPLETDDRTIEVTELRERGLYSQERFGRSYYAEDVDLSDNDFDFAQASAEQAKWEAQQARDASRFRTTAARNPAERPLNLEQPAEVAEPRVEYISQPVVQDTAAITARQ